MPPAPKEGRMRRRHAKQCCENCRAAKSRCELPNTEVRPSNEPLDRKVACHRCKVLGKTCVVAPLEPKPRRKRNTGNSPSSNTSVIRRPQIRETPGSSNFSKTFVNLILPTFSSEIDTEVRSSAERSPKEQKQSSHLPKRWLNKFYIRPSLHLRQQLCNVEGFNSTGNNRRFPPSSAEPIEDVLSLVSGDFSETLSSRFQPYYLWFPHLERISRMREIHQEYPNESTSLLLACIYLMASEGLENFSDINRVREQLSAIVQRDCLSLILQAPNDLHAVQALHLVSHVPVRFLPDAHLGDGTLTVAMDISRSIGLHNAPATLSRAIRDKRKDYKCFFQTATWYSLCVSKHIAVFSKDSDHIPHPDAFHDVINPMECTQYFRQSFNGSDESGITEVYCQVGFLGLYFRVRALYAQQEVCSQILNRITSAENSSSVPAREVNEMLDGYTEILNRNELECQVILNSYVDTKPIQHRKDTFIPLYTHWINLELSTVAFVVSVCGLESLFFDSRDKMVGGLKLRELLENNHEVKYCVAKHGQACLARYNGVLSIFCTSANLLKSDAREHGAFLCPFPRFWTSAAVLSAAILILEARAAGMLYWNARDSVDTSVFLMEATATAMKSIDLSSDVSGGNVFAAVGEVLDEISSVLKRWNEQLRLQKYWNPKLCARTRSSPQRLSILASPDGIHEDIYDPSNSSFQLTFPDWDPSNELSLMDNNYQAESSTQAGDRWLQIIFNNSSVSP